QAKTVPAAHTVIVGIDTVQAIDYGATYGGPGSPKGDISVNFSVEPALVDTFNSQQASSYTLLPENAYEFEKTSAIIPAGEKYTSELKLKINGNLELEKEEYLLPVTMKVNNGSIPVNKDLQTTYFLIKTNKVLPLNTGIIITGMMVNPYGSDSPEKGTEKYDFTVPGGMEYIQLMALRDIDFSETPHSLVVGRHYGDLVNGWASGEGT